MLTCCDFFLDKDRLKIIRELAGASIYEERRRRIRCWNELTSVLDPDSGVIPDLDSGVLKNKKKDLKCSITTK